MEAFKEFLVNYGFEILTTLITAFVGFLGVLIKNLVNKFLNDKTKQSIAKIVVSGIQQCYQELDGPAKLEKAIETMTTLLNEKGIKCTELEMRMLIEGAIGEFKDAFNKDNNSESSVTEEEDTTLEQQLENL